jgi:hypothetical protein
LRKLLLSLSSKESSEEEDGGDGNMAMGWIGRSSLREKQIGFDASAKVKPWVKIQS